MTKLISLLLATLLLSFNILFLFSCTSDGKKDGDGTSDNSGDGNTGKEEDGGTENGAVIKVPEYKDYNRGTINFKDIVYSRPNVQAIADSFNAVTEKIKANQTAFEEQIAAIEDLEDEYVTVYTMSAFANVYNSKDSSNSYWCDEYEYLTTNFPTFSKSVESMFVAAANSPHAERFENEYFGAGLIEEYKDGGIYTEELVLKMEKEAELESEYSSLSTATVIITYTDDKGDKNKDNDVTVTDTVDNVTMLMKEEYGENSKRFLAVELEIQYLYKDALNERSSELLVELFKARADIGEEYRDGDYLDFAYNSIYHDYEREKSLAFFKNVADYVIPVYINLAKNNVFSENNKTGKAEKVDKVTLINTAYDVLCETDKELGSIYSYMLQHGLYDVDAYSDNRFQGSFTTYLDTYEAPYLFVSTDGKATDYITLFHEFGHFADFYVNYNSTISVDLSEVSSQALEFLMLTRLDVVLKQSTLDYLIRYEFENALLTLIYQSLYALFEHHAYSIPKEEISKASLENAIKSAATDLNLDPNYYNKLEIVMIPHIFLYPTYVQSYCTSLTASLEIYFTETESKGAGFAAYNELLNRADSTLTFEEHLERASLSSPFDEDVLMEIADKIHYAMFGKHYFSANKDNASA